MNKVTIYSQPEYLSSALFLAKNLRESGIPVKVETSLWFYVESPDDVVRSLNGNQQYDLVTMSMAVAATIPEDAIRPFPSVN